MKALVVASASMLMLTACDSQPQPAAEAPTPTGPSAPTPSPSPPEPTAPERAPSQSAPFYVGRWAAAETACGHAFWQITERGLETSGGVNCRFSDVKAIATGFEAAAQCIGPKAEDVTRIRFAYAQSAKALLVDAEPLANVGLVTCKSP